MTIWFLICVLFYLWPAVIISLYAGEKGRSSAAYFFLSVLFTPVVSSLMLIAGGEKREIKNNAL
ncbi:hypothetical protein [uncultured Vibrio sp.]|uniref:hypothetical protein n=1 Tax=uncultured Vibrio sp. TaxID=114054 RepID=UPI002631D696|nr:hypothetical protein [uncultured Vibrio sp.]